MLHSQERADIYHGLHFLYHPGSPVLPEVEIAGVVVIDEVSRHECATAKSSPLRAFRCPPGFLKTVDFYHQVFVFHFSLYDFDNFGAERLREGVR